MIDNKTDAAESREFSDDELEHAVGGLMAKPDAAPQMKLKVSEDPCQGGQLI